MAKAEQQPCQITYSGGNTERNFMKTQVLIAACLGVLACQSGLAQSSRQTLQGHVPAVVTSLQPIGRLPSTTYLNLAIGLPLRNREALTNQLQQIYDPASPNFRRYLTPEQFTEMFGPTEQDYRAVIAFARANGLTVTGTDSNRTLVGVSARVADVEKVFNVTMRTYQHPRENRIFFAPDTEPSVNLAVSLLGISGLNNYVVPRPLLHKSASQDKAGQATPAVGSAPDHSSYLGSDFRSAYAPGVSLTGTGQTVGLLEFASGFYQSDVTAYETLAGLPHVPVVAVLLDGYNGGPGVANDEVSLDIDMAIAMAPGLSKVKVYEGNLTDTILNAMAADGATVKQIGASWSYPIDVNTDPIFLRFARQGQSFFNASGDDDAYTPGTVPTPSDDPNITIVGGTTLRTTGPGGAWLSETVWNWRTPNPNGGDSGSSGGISTTYAIPTWQQGISMTANQGSTTYRNLPDVALTADNVWVIYGNGQSGSFGGTSAATPLWAGFTALVNQQAVSGGNPPVGFINPAVYAIGKGSGYTSAFHDITTGDNTWSGSPGKFFAVPGYDLCTGWGTPVGQNLINALTFVSGGTPDGILEVSVTPFDRAALLEGATETIFVQVTDGPPVTNATVIATINGGTNLVFSNNGVAPDVKANDSIYSANLVVPLNTNDLTLSFLITAPGKTNSTNVVTYSVVPVPVNDYFTNATKVPPVGALYLSNNKFATIEPGEPQHAGVATVAASLWWNWSPVNATNVFIDTTGSEIDTVVAVYTGPSVSNLTQVAATNDVGVKRQAYLNFNAAAGASYRIAVASATSNSTGSLRLLIAPGGQPDVNAPTVFVTSPPSGLYVTNFLLTVSGTANDPQPNASGVDQVFVSLNGQLPFAATGTTNWSRTFGLSQGLNTIMVTAEDIAGNISDPVSIQVTYVIINPPNDLFADAIPLAGNSGSTSALTTNASKEFNEPNHAGNVGGKSVWWSFQPSVDGVLTLSTTNSTFDTLLALYLGDTVTNLTAIASNDDAYDGAPGGFSALTQAVRSNQTYHIAVDGFDGASGVAFLGYTFTPATVYSLAISSAGGGTVTPSSGDVATNSTVVLTATPDPFFAFDSWSGSYSATANPLSIVIYSNINLTAHFLPISFADDFETGNLLKLGWSASGDAPWLVQTNTVLAGSFAAQSGVIGDSQTSSLVLTTNFGGGTASFYFKVSSEENWDFLNFYVDGALLQQWSGEVGWTSYSFPLSAGTHTLEWRYAKDASLSAGLDAAFIDDVNLPLGDPPSLPAPAFLELRGQPDGGLVLQLQGQPNQQYVIQATTDFTVWQNISTNFTTDGVIRFVDPGAATYQFRFYRAAVQ